VSRTIFKGFFPVMLWRHYHRAVTQKQAAAFWKIEPPKIDGKTIAFANFFKPDKNRASRRWRREDRFCAGGGSGQTPPSFAQIVALISQYFIE
jgi:hypothetical protein